MAIYQYDGSQKTPKNYIGFRVAVSINGTLHQKWYKETIDLPKEAKDLERQWKFEQQLHKTANIRNRQEKIQNSAYITGVSGIKMKFITTKRKLKNGEERHYYTPAFVVSGSSNSKKFLKHFNIKTSGFDMAWFKACSYAADKYGKILLDSILKQKPSVQQFQIIYRWQKKLGMEIPIHRLPNELL